MSPTSLSPTTLLDNSYQCSRSNNFFNNFCILICKENVISQLQPMFEKYTPVYYIKCFTWRLLYITRCNSIQILRTLTCDMYEKEPIKISNVTANQNPSKNINLKTFLPGVLCHFEIDYFVQKICFCQ